MFSILAAANTTETKTAAAKTRRAAAAAQFKGENMEDQKPNHASTSAEIVDYYDRHLNLTLRELSDMTGRTIAELKRMIMQ
jgi:hypothetical protein